MMTVLDGGWSPNSPTQGDILVCVGYKHHWELVNGKSGSIRHFHTAESGKPHLVAALDLYEDQEIQLLLCYNRNITTTSKIHELYVCAFADTCHFQKIADETSTNTEFDFHWNSVPTDIGNSILSLNLLRNCLTRNICSLRVSLRHRIHVKFHGNSSYCKRQSCTHYDDAQITTNFVQKRHILLNYSTGILPE